MQSKKKMLLASSGTDALNFGEIVFNKPLSKMKLAYISTAMGGVEDKSYVEQRRKRMLREGYNFEEVNIRGKTENELHEILVNKEAIYVEGGNTFYLLKCVKESGFDKVVNRFIEQGGIYVGSSAGSYVTCPTIEMSTWKPAEAIKKRYGLKNLTALKLVPFLMSVHYDLKNKEALQKHIAETNYPVKILRDGQALLIKNKTIKLLGGKETII